MSNVSLLPDFTGVDGSIAAKEATAAPRRECRLDDFKTVLLTCCIRGTQRLNLLHIAISSFAQSMCNQAMLLLTERLGMTSGGIETFSMFTAAAKFRKKRESFGVAKLILIVDAHAQHQQPRPLTRSALDLCYLTEVLRRHTADTACRQPLLLREFACCCCP
jgi:hypothetical protein